ncbi:MAG: pyridoxal-phosphate dependent enzyme [Kiritimatiellales bacterium]|nr:pyridoxal-phosphate dependent enzyme [Kiritimatiellales bacterium]
MENQNRVITANDIEEARKRYPPELIHNTRLYEHQGLSEQFDASIWLDRQDEQPIRSYKGRGAFTAADAMTNEQLEKGLVCASHGNHAQGVAVVCNHLEVKGTIFMPETTPPIKVNATQRRGNGYVEVRKVGDSYDEADRNALEFASETDATFIHPFDDYGTVTGQGTVGLDILQKMQEMGKSVDMVLAPGGGGGLSAGIATYMNERSPNTEVVVVETTKSAAITASLEAQQVVTRDNISHFVESTAVQTPGKIPIEILSRLGIKTVTVDEGSLCNTWCEMFDDGVVAELAGVLSINALNEVQNLIRGKVVVCVISGGNVDRDDIPMFTRRANAFKRTMVILRLSIPARSGSLLDFLDNTGIRETGVNIDRFEFDKLGDHEPDKSTIRRMDLSANDPEDLSAFLEKLKGVPNCRVEDITDQEI